MISDIADRLMHNQEVVRNIVAATVNRDSEFKIILGRANEHMYSKDIFLPGKRSIAIKNRNLLELLDGTGLIQSNLGYLNPEEKPSSINILGFKEPRDSSKEQLRTELKDYLRENFPDENLVHELFHIKTWPHVSFNPSYSVSRMRIQQVADAFFYISAGETNHSDLGKNKSVTLSLRSGKKMVLDSQWNRNSHFMSSEGYQVRVLGTTKDQNLLNTGDLELYTSFDPRTERFFNKAVEHYQEEGRLLSFKNGEFDKVGLFYSKPVHVMQQILGQSYNLQHFKTPK